MSKSLIAKSCGHNPLDNNTTHTLNKTQCGHILWLLPSYKKTIVSMGKAVSLDKRVKHKVETIQKSKKS